jgi:hypothetical protein
MLKNTLLLSEILMKCLICDQVWEWFSVVKLLVILMESVSSNQSTHLYNDHRKFCYVLPQQAKYNLKCWCILPVYSW